MLQTILVLLIIVAAFALTMVILKVQERHIREDGAITKNMFTNVIFARTKMSKLPQ